ncbi:MAG: HIT family protein [Clostridiales bacterium]|jgi:histidine triad (HIT) family protein|nr:HIT family protein [Clostridiales bacterium]
MSDCLFCKIVAGDAPSSKLYEDDEVCVILDRFPKNEGECLVITKNHYENIFDLEPSLGKKIFDISKKTAEKLKAELPIDGINLLQNNGECAGQMIKHFHMHIIPRKAGDSVAFIGERLDPSESEFESIKEKLKLS